MTARRPKVFMLSYVEAPWLPPMYNAALVLAAGGIEVEALCLTQRPESTPPEHPAPGFAWERMALRTRSFFHRRLPRATSSRLGAAAQYLLSYGEFLAKTVARALRSGADLYEANDLPTLLPLVVAAKLRRKPLVYRAHELWPETSARVTFARFWRFLERRLVPRCDLVVAPEENRARIYQEEYGARRPPLVVHNCPPYRPPEQSTLLRDELARRAVPFTTVVLYQGLVDSIRCVEEMAEASKRFAPGAVLVIIGSGFGAWADPAARLAGYERVVLLPRVPYTELPKITASADVGMLLYRNDCRNNLYCAPNKLYEYMMMGLPVIAPRFPGMVPVVEGEVVGKCVDPSSPEDIARAVDELAADPALRRRMKENGLRLSSERYNWEIESRPLLRRYQEMLGVTPEPAQPAVAVAS